MRKHKFIILFLMVVLISTTFTIYKNESKIEEDTIFVESNLPKEIMDTSSNKEINETVNIKSGKDCTVEPYTENLDEDIPFDIKEADKFHSEDVLYADNMIYIRFNKDFNGTLSSEMKEAGIGKLEFLFETNEYVFYKGYLYVNEDVDVVLNKVRALDEVSLAEYNFVYETTDVDVSSNPNSNSQWSLDYGNVREAWNYLDELGIPGGSSDVVVAVVDVGVDVDHEDLNDNIYINSDEIEDNGIDDDNNGYVDDYDGVCFYDQLTRDYFGIHGTHVAGIIAAENNNKCVVGIAYNTKIMNVNVGTQEGMREVAYSIEGIIYAYQNGADVINMSYGNNAYSIAEEDACEAAKNAGCVLIAAAGNSGDKTGDEENVTIYPSGYDSVLSVMSIDSNCVESYFTNYNTDERNIYEVYAPGSDIYSTLPHDMGYIKSESGTSMAAPFVSAEAALLISKYKDESYYSPDLIYSIIKDSANVDVTCYHNIEHPMPKGVNVYNALTYLDNALTLNDPNFIDIDTSESISDSLTMNYTNRNIKINLNYVDEVQNVNTTITVDNDFISVNDNILTISKYIENCTVDVNVNVTYEIYGISKTKSFTIPLTISSPYTKCGDDLNWDIENGVLTIEGTGDMYSYTNTNAPWDAFTSTITSVELKQGVTSIGDYAFDNCSNLDNIIIPESVTSIGENVFNNCDKLQTIYVVKNSYADTYINDSSKMEYLNDEGEIILKSISFNEDTISLKEGSTKTLEVIYNPYNIKDKSVTYTSSDDSIVSVNNNTITALKAGTVTITATSSSGLKTTCKVSVEHVWNEGEITTEATCTSEGIKTYTCTKCNATYTKTIDALGHDYVTNITKATSKNGSITTTCSRCDYQKTSIIYYPKTITLSYATTTYNGSYKKPTITLKDSNGKVIDYSNYSITYTNNKYVGKATVKVTLNNDQYNTVLTKNFTIKPKTTSISSLTKASKAFSVKWNKISTQCSGYQIEYSTNSKFSSYKTVSITSYKTTSKKISNLKSNKKYYVRIRTYKTVNNTKYYSNWSSYKTVTTK